jgi:dodecin
LPGTAAGLALSL